MKTGARSKVYPIQIVARRTGLNLDVLRAWERRYGVVEPERSDGGRRLYSAADIERLSLLGRVVDRGLRIGDARRMDDAALRSFLAESASKEQPVDGGGSKDARGAAKQARAATLVGPGAEPVDETASDSAATHLERSKRAVEAFDSHALTRALARANVSLSLRALLDGVVAPLLAWIGERWSEGKLCVAQEHMASAAIRSMLLADLAAGATGAQSPCIVVTTPAHELHELGALFAAVVATSAGWRVEYLGPNLPAGEIAIATRRCEADAVGLSVARPVRDPAVIAELNELSRRLPRKVALLVGGTGSATYAEAIRAARARRFEDCWSFARYLEAHPGGTK
jgi:DNA-binding transcriptional MerR regulator/methylmalonyl-CoA mutase cobalamin-binding subunit